jgi:hypothetical protein
VGVKFEPMTSRRALLKAGTGFAAGAAVVPLPPNAAVAQSQDSEAATLEHLLRADPNTRRILLKGGTIISMDPTVGDFAQGDVPRFADARIIKKMCPTLPILISLSVIPGILIDLPKISVRADHGHNQLYVCAPRIVPL